ncbi:hypothetical protein VITU102760_24780 [Vibrio tubiashii]|nr:hypothetical protein [Vibrio tubiashii]
MKNNKLSFVLVALLSLSGCVSQSYKDNQKESQNIGDEIQQYTAKASYEKAVSIELPPFDPSELENSSDPFWLKNRINYTVAGVSLNIVLEQLINNRPDQKQIEVFYGEEVDPNQLVSLSLKDGTIKEAFNLLTSETDYGFIYKENRVEIERFISKSFSIPVPPGETSMQMGNQGKKASDDEGAIIEGQFINTVIENENIVNKMIQNIEGILTVNVKDENGRETYIDGAVRSIDGLSMLTVTASPSKMRKVENYVNDVKAELAKQVLLDFRVLEFRSTLNDDRGADLNLVRDIGEGTLQFFTQGTSLNPVSAGYGFSFKGVNGWEGTTAFIRALEKQGTVSVESPITKLAMNNYPVQVTQNKQNPYLEDLSTTVNEGVVTTDFTRGNVPEGIDFATISNVQEEFVSVHVTGKMKSVVGQELREIGNNKIQFYTTRESDINFTGKMRYGRTYIIARVSQTKVASEKTENFGTEYIGSNAANKEHVETLILLTPRRFEQ